MTMQLFETDPSWGAKFRRLFGTYSAKMALVPWVDDLKVRCLIWARCVRVCVLLRVFSVLGLQSFH